MNSRPTRRAVLSAGAVGLVAACTARRPPGAVRPARPHPDVALTAAAVSRELALLTAYDAALAATPALASRLAPLRAEHAEHLRALGAGPAGNPTASPAPAPAPEPARGAGGQARSSLATAERTAAAAHAAATVTASARLAAVLASLAASEASHQVALG